MGPLHHQRSVEDMEILLVRSRLRWLGHVSRMEDNRPVKSLLYDELTEGTRPVGRPKLRYKDTFKSGLKCGNALGQWKAIVENRTEWRHNSSNMQQSEREESECKGETNGYELEEKGRELEKTDYLLYFKLTIYCVCTDLCCNRFRD